MVLNPIFLILEISFKSDIPLINDAKINGTAINFKRFINMVPNGLIQSVTKPLPPSIVFIIKPKMIPNTIPIKIFQCNASFFINYITFNLNLKDKKKIKIEVTLFVYCVRFIEN